MDRQSKQANIRLNKDLVWVERTSRLLDNKFKIGGFSFGLDPLLNFVPFLGKPISFAVSTLLVIIMWRNGASTKLAIKMIINVLIDAIFGSIPLFGNIFDFFHKANQKNITLLQQYYYEDKHRGSSLLYLVGILGLLILISAAIIFAMWKISTWIFNILF